MLDSEKKKMLAGKLYHAGDREIQADQATAKAWGRDCQHSFEPGQSHGQFTLILSANAAPKLLFASPEEFCPLSFSVLSSSVGLWIVIVQAAGAPTSLIGSSSCKENWMK
jgi:Maltose acetyltransferase